MIPWLDTETLRFPPAGSALRDPNGLLAAGGDLSPQRILQAYRQGIFPWYSEPDPILWWSPDPRAVILPDTLHIPRSLQKTLKRGLFRITVDQAFATVIRHCANGSSIHRERGTWITPAMQAAYARLHELGHAHSVEAWQGDVLVGGLYGIAIGQVFFGESMFSHVPDASRVAFACFARWLFSSGFVLIDSQVGNPHMARFGTVAMPRRQYLARLQHCDLPCPVRDWQRVLDWQAGA